MRVTMHSKSVLYNLSLSLTLTALGTIQMHGSNMSVDNKSGMEDIKHCPMVEDKGEKIKWKFKSHFQLAN